MSATSSSLEQTLLRARAAQEAWAALPLEKRLEPIARLRARLAAEPKVLAEIVAAEIGKSRFEAIGSEVLPVAEVCAFLMKRAPGILAPRTETLRGTMPFTGSALVRHLPWGVVALLVPWNYPLFLCASSALPALAAGNAVAMKASPRAAKTVEAFGKWLHEAGVPPDLTPVLESSDEAGRELAASRFIDKIVFTGSSRTGRAVLTAAAQNLVPATMELSGYDAVYVLRDADVELAASAVTFGLRLNAGRTCICPRRVFVEEPVAAEFTRRLSASLAEKKLLSPMDPLTLREADALADKLRATPNTSFLFERRQGDAERVVAAAGGAEALAAAQGNFVPAVVVAKVQDTEEAFKLSGASPYALGASIFTQSDVKARALAARTRAGLVSVNECVAAGGEAALPFGGCGESGYGARGGVEGLLDMTRPQAVALPEGTLRPHHEIGNESEELVLALLRARHAGKIEERVSGWFDTARESLKWWRGRK